MIKKIILTLIFIITLGSFYYINEVNYKKQVEIREEIVEHPENLPTKEVALNSSFGFKNLKADIYRLEAVQYIGGNAFHSEYKKYLFAMLDIITELNPYFEHPYEIGQLLLPSYSPMYESLSETEQEKHTNEAVELGLKGIENYCDTEKIKLINNENNLYKIWTEDKYKNPCKSYTIPYYLAFVYYYYKNDAISAAKYYKIASAVEDSIEGTKSMAAIMQGKGGDRQKAFFMFLNIAKYVEPEAEDCQSFAGELEQIGNSIFYKGDLKISGNLLKDIEKVRTEVSKNLTKDQSLDNSKCINYVNKATRELNLTYLDAIENYYYENNQKHSKNVKELFEKGYMDYFVKDFQQFEGYEIIYIFDEKLGKYNYEMGSY